MRNSVIRSSILVTAFFVGGHAFFYALILGVNKTLDPVGFGRFYAAWAVLNVLVTPAPILGLLLTRHVADTQRAAGRHAVAPALAWAVRTILPWLGGGAVLAAAILYFGGAMVGVNSYALAIVTPALAAACAVVEMLRASFQGTQRFLWFGGIWLAWSAAQAVAAYLLLRWVGAPWAALAGMLLASVATALVLSGIVLRGAGSARAVVPAAMPAAGETAEGGPASLAGAVPLIVAQCGLALFVNAHIGFAYVSLSATALGAFAAAAVLPKALITATQPLAQVVMPVVVDTRGERRRNRQAVAKALTLALVVGAAGMAVLWGVSGLVCGGPYGFRFCQTPLMLHLALAAVPIAVLKTWISADLGRRRYRLAQLPVAGVVALFAVLFVVRPDGAGIAWIYVAGSWALLGVFALAKLASDLAERRAAAAGESAVPVRPPASP